MTQKQEVEQIKSEIMAEVKKFADDINAYNRALVMFCDEDTAIKVLNYVQKQRQALAGTKP